MDVPKNRKPLLLVAGAIALFLFFGGADWVINATFYPWALADPPLLDAWTGRLTTGKRPTPRCGDRASTGRLRQPDWLLSPMQPDRRHCGDL